MRNINILEILRWSLKGKSLSRSILNITTSRLPTLKGITLDLGGGGSPTYKSTLRIEGEFINMDAVQEANPTVVGNLEDQLPFENNYADTALLFNTLEHIYDYQHVVNEMYRVLKKDGKALIFVPFIFPFHTYQTEKFLINDYFRYTSSGLEKILTTSGFKDIKIEPLGGLFIIVAEFLGYAVKFNLLKSLIYVICSLIEKLYSALKTKSAEKYPLAYFVTAIK